MSFATSWGDVLQFYWYLFVLAAGIITFILYHIVHLVKSTESPEYNPKLPDSVDEALRIVNEITAADSTWRIQDIKELYSDKEWKFEDLGYVLDVISDVGFTRFSLYFPVGHPDKDGIPSFRIGESVAFTRMESPLGTEAKNPTTYVTMSLA